jgi:hypothetical protein
MDSSNTDFDVKTSISYAMYHKKFQKACIDCLNHKQSKFGSHTSRKTFYLFGRWFGANLEALSRDARHKTLKNAQRYSRDAGKSFLYPPSHYMYSNCALVHCYYRPSTYYYIYYINSTCNHIFLISTYYSKHMYSFVYMYIWAIIFGFTIH